MGWLSRWSLVQGGPLFSHRLLLIRYVLYDSNTSSSAAIFAHIPQRRTVMRTRRLHLLLPLSLSLGALKVVMAITPGHGSELQGG